MSFESSLSHSNLQPSLRSALNLQVHCESQAIGKIHRAILRSTPSAVDTADLQDMVLSHENANHNIS